MSYEVEQKINGRIYLYKATSVWDKDKKQSRQKREYIGPKERVYKERSAKTNPNIVSKSFGDVYLLRCLCKRLGLEDILKKHFPDCYREIINLSSFFLSNSSESYLYPYWHNEHFFNNSKVLSSSSISSLYKNLGESNRVNFMKDWANKLKPSKGIYYDITSVSSYSTHIENVEWGYNRDKETLPQINIGIAVCSKTSLPIYYNVYPGSICDVKTLKNTIKVLNIFKLKDLLLIMDRGFCSKQNMIDMNDSNIKFIQPISMSLNLSKNLIDKYFDKIQKPNHYFIHKKKIMSKILEEIDLSGMNLDAHIIFNEEKALSFRNNIWRTVMELESSNKEIFKNDEDASLYIENNIIEKFRKYLIFDKKSGKLLRDDNLLQKHYIKSGCIIMFSNIKNLNTNYVLEKYKKRNMVEEDICVFKNSLDGNRLRGHESATTDGRIFIKFISMILNSKISDALKDHEKLKHYSIKQILLELKKIKINSIDEKTPFITEISKTQATIFDACNIDKDSIAYKDGY